MKKYHYIILCFILMMAVSCKEEQLGQFPTDNIAPQPVKNVKVTNLPGSVSLTYDLPDEEDILYVQAVYTLSNGKAGIAKSSVFNSTMIIDGFGKSEKRTILLQTVDRSQNVSEEVEVEIHPQDSPIYEILDNIVIHDYFGGFKIQTVNPLKKTVVIGILGKDDVTGLYTHSIENIYFSGENLTQTIRGLENEPKPYGIFVRDTYDNSTDTIYVDIAPLFEEEIPKSGFLPMPLSLRYSLHSYGNSSMPQLWDNIYNVDNNLYYITTGNSVMPYFTFNMGVKATLSHFKLWQRVDYMYTLHNARSFEIWGTNNKVLAEDAETLGWEENSGWIKLAVCESRRPSANIPIDAANPLTTEDIEYAKAGEDFEITAETSVQYIRFKLVRTWSGSSGVHINELTFWGKIDN